MGNYSQGLNFPRSYLFEMDVLELKDASQVTEPNEGIWCRQLAEKSHVWSHLGIRKMGSPQQG